MAFRKKVDLEGLTPEEVDQLAFSKIVASLSASEQSSIKMRSKLEASGFPDASIDAAIGKARDIGVLDDRRYAECLVRSTLASSKGLCFIKGEIESLGLDIEDLDAYQEYAETDEEDRVSAALDFLERHPPRSKDVYASCQRKLLSRGFDHDIATQATKLFMKNL